MQGDDGDQLPAKLKNRGHMFLVDVPTYAAVCDLGDPDVAAVYLILAAGTGADNRTSTWSREAVNKRTGLNWRKADAAMEKLERAGLLRWLSGKGTRKPRLYLPQVETRPAMQKHVEELADRLECGGSQPFTASEKAAATIGKSQGWFVQDEAGMFQFVPERPMVKAYLPMSLVGDEKGKAIAGSTMVERIRMSRDHMAFRLLVDLYALQDLAEHGGVNRHWLEHQFTRGETSTDTGSIRVWVFTAKTLSARVQSGPLAHHWRKPTAEETKAGINGAKDFYERVQILDDAGVLEWAYHLAEDEAEGSTTIYPVGVKRNGKMVWAELEAIVGGYAIRAACALGCYPGQAIEWEDRAPARFILPVNRMARRAALVGIPRLRYRAKTSNTSRWRQELVEAATAQIEVFRGIIADRAPQLLAEADRRLADFNVSSTETSTLVQRDINDSSWSGSDIPPADACVALGASTDDSGYPMAASERF